MMPNSIHGILILRECQESYKISRNKQYLQNLKHARDLSKWCEQFESKAQMLCFTYINVK